MKNRIEEYRKPLGLSQYRLGKKIGISITVGLKYTRTYFHKDGYYVYGWSPTSLSVRRY